MTISAPVPWEAFSDRSYFDMWAVRPVDCSDFGMSFHVPSKQEAEFLAELFNHLPGSAELFKNKYNAKYPPRKKAFDA